MNENGADRILGMGDVISLVEKAAASIEQEDAEAMAAKMAEGRFDLDDMAKQLQLMVDDLAGERDAAQMLHKRVVDEYSWERVTDKTEQFYESLLGKGRTGRAARRQGSLLGRNR